MRLFSLSSLVACAFASLPDAPKVEVPQDVLQSFMVSSDVNRPGQFSRAISIMPSWRSDVPKVKVLVEQAQALVANITDNYMGMNFIDICRSIITVHRPLAEGPLVEFAIGHALNAFMRAFHIIRNLNMDIVTDFGKLRTADSETVQFLCENSEVVRIAAIQTLRDGDVKFVCAKFRDVIAQQASLIESIIAQGLSSHGALHRLYMVLTSDEHSSIADAVNYLHAIPVIPRQFQYFFIYAIVKEFQDYEQFYKQIENSTEVSNVLGMPVAQLKHIVAPKVMDFLSRIL